MEETHCEELEDQFVSITQLCIPTSSQEEKLHDCPFARESENLAGPNEDACSSSPDMTQSQHAPMIMVSLPDSDTSLRDDAVFSTPPYRHQQLSSSEDQNIFHECAKIVDLDDDNDLREAGFKGLGGGAGDGETAAVNDTEVVCFDDCETMPVHEAEVVCLDPTEAETLDGDAVKVISEGGVVIRGGFFDVENLSAVGMAKDGALVEQNHGLERFNAPNAVGNSVAGNVTRGECGFERVGKIVEVENNVFGVGKKRQLLDSLKGEDKVDEVERRKRNRQFLEFLDMLKVVIGYTRDKGCEEDVNFLETVVRPRWWPPVGDL